MVGFEAEALEHADVEIGERGRGFWIEGEVLAVLEAAAGQQHGQVDVRVGVRAAHAGAIEDHRAVEQRLAHKTAQPVAA